MPSLGVLIDNLLVPAVDIRLIKQVVDILDGMIQIIPQENALNFFLGRFIFVEVPSPKTKFWFFGEFIQHTLHFT